MSEGASSRTAPSAPGSAGAWLLASRPATLVAAVVPVVVGTACAWALGGFRAGPALGALLVAIFVQIGTNFANDVFDYEKGADTGERLGPTRAVQAGLLSARSVRIGMVVVFGLAVVSGAYLALVAGWPLAIIGIVAILSGLAYTGGPYPLAYHGLGDIFVLIFFGFVAVCGTVYVQLGFVPTIAVWASVPVGCLATGILVVNNVRDRETDAQAGKRTLAVRLGRRGGLAEYGTLLLAAYLVPVGLVIYGFSLWLLLPLATLPRGVRLCFELARLEGRALNATLVGTARLLMLFGLLLAAGIANSPVS